MEILVLYKAFEKAGKQPCSYNDPHRGEKMRMYSGAKQQLFEALRRKYQSGQLHSDRADALIQAITASSDNPERFWGSSKSARTNQAMFVHEKTERLFEELLRLWRETQPAEE